MGNINDSIIKKNKAPKHIVQHTQRALSPQPGVRAHHDGHQPRAMVLERMVVQGLRRLERPGFDFLASGLHIRVEVEPIRSTLQQLVAAKLSLHRQMLQRRRPLRHDLLCGYALRDDADLRWVSARHSAFVSVWVVLLYICPKNYTTVKFKTIHNKANELYYYYY